MALSSDHHHNLEQERDVSVCTSNLSPVSCDLQHMSLLLNVTFCVMSNEVYVSFLFFLDAL